MPTNTNLCLSGLVLRERTRTENKNHINLYISLYPPPSSVSIFFLSAMDYTLSIKTHSVRWWATVPQVYSHHCSPSEVYLHQHGLLTGPSGCPYPPQHGKSPAPRARLQTPAVPFALLKYFWVAALGASGFSWSFGQGWVFSLFAILVLESAGSSCDHHRVDHTLLTLVTTASACDLNPVTYTHLCLYAKYKFGKN